MRLRATSTLLCLLAALCLAPPLGAQEQKPQQPFRILVEEWTLALDLIERDLLLPDLSDERALHLKERLAAIRGEAMERQASIEQQLDPLGNQLEALGLAPAADEPPEFEAIADERRRVNEGIATYEGQTKQAALIIEQAEELIQSINARNFGRAIKTLLKGFPVALAPDTLKRGVPEFFGRLALLSQAPLEWWQSLPEAQRGGAVVLRLAVVVVLALVLGLGLRYGLLRWFGRDPGVEHPTYARRLTAGIGEGLASGIVPALIFGGFLYRVGRDQAVISGRFADLVVALCIAMIILVLACALPRAVLAPDLPAWRLVWLSPERARAINRLITFIAIIFAIDLFFDLAGTGPESSDALLSLYHFVTNSLEAVGVLALVRGRWWRLEAPEGQEPAPDDTEQDDEAAPVSRQFWTGLRLLIGTLALASIGASLIGYANLGTYLINNLLFSGVAVGVLFLLRGLLREGIGAALRSGALREQLALGYPTRRLLKFWLRAFLDLLIFGSGIFLVLTFWGVPVEDMLDWGGEALQGITIGSVTVSITDLLSALAVFVVALVVTRLLQRLLSERILPHTALDSGLRHSLAAGFGYMGLAIAVTLGVSALGLDLTNLALIFGALSVGIGFGLQNVANNLVSGLILLIERPIKVGDWVVVGANEGFVKKIRLRSTELETFQRAAIVVPNAEIVSTAVVNWTHKDRYGRVDVPIRVAFGSDVEQVMETLMTCLRETRGVVDWPAPQVLFRRYGESALEFEARGFLANIEYIYQVQSELLTAIDKAFRAAGIEVPYPQRDLHLKDVEALKRVLDLPARADEPQAPRLRPVEGGSGEGEG